MDQNEFTTSKTRRCFQSIKYRNVFEIAEKMRGNGRWHVSLTKFDFDSSANKKLKNVVIHFTKTDKVVQIPLFDINKSSLES